MKRCPYCGAELNDESHFCTECGKELPKGNICPHCGASVNGGDAFCTNCGKSVAVTDGKESQSVEDDSYYGEENSLKKYFPYIVGGFIALIIIGGLYYCGSNPKETDKIGVIDSINSIDSLAEVVDSSETEVVEPDTLLLKVVTFHKKEEGENCPIEVDMYAEIPETENQRLSDKVNHFLYITLKDEFTWDGDSLGSYFSNYKDGQATIDFYGNAKMEELSLMGGGKESAYMKKVYENENLISYSIEFVYLDADSIGKYGSMAKSKKFYKTFEKKNGEWFKIDPTREGVGGLAKMIWNEIRNNVVYNPNYPKTISEEDCWMGCNYIAMKNGIIITYDKCPYYQIDGEFYFPYSKISRFLETNTLALLGIDNYGGGNGDYSKYVGRWRLDSTIEGGRKMRMEVKLKADKSGEFVVFQLKGNSDDVLVYEQYPQCVVMDGVIYLTKNGEIIKGKTPQLKMGSDGLYSIDNQKYVRVSD